MATTIKGNGTDVGLYIGGTLITNLTSNDFSVEHSPREATTKNSSGWSESLEGLRSATFSASGYFEEDAAYNFENLYAAISTRATVTVRYSSEVAGDKYYEASAWVTSMSRSAPLEETETFEMSFQVTGAITEGTVV